MASHQYPAGHKPTMTEKVKEKVAVLKDKLTGEDHHASSGTTSTTTPMTGTHAGHNTQGESMVDKIKDKLPGQHGTTTGHHDSSAYPSSTGTTGYGGHQTSTLR